MPSRDSTGQFPFAHYRVLAHLVLAAILLSSALGCSGGGKKEYAYVAAPDAVLRDRVAAVYNKTGAIHNGERVQVLEHMRNKRFVRVRSPRGEEGWVQERYLTDQETYDQLQQLAQKYKDTPGQASAVTKAPVNLHAIPGRKTEHLYQLPENDKLELLERQIVDRNAPAQPSPSDKETDTDTAGEDQDNMNGPPAILEDWWLVRDSQQRVGWILGRMLYVDAPIDIAMYAEGQRIVSFNVLDTVNDKEQGKQVPEYLVLLTENKDGLPYDFDQIRVYTWNVKRHRYETAYRDHDLFGTLPAVLGKQDFGKEGELRTFTLHLKDDSGNSHDVTYKFTPPLVHVVLPEGLTAKELHRPPDKSRARTRS